jgi:hypothetical protein
MRKGYPIAMLVLMTALPAMAAKFKGRTVLKDVNPTGVSDKDHKHQQYDLFFTSTDKQYTCRTDGKHSMNATDFVVGTTMKYEVNGKKGKLTNPDGKDVDCKIVRVELLSATP